MKYIPLKKATDAPRNWRTKEGKRVGIGGEIVIKRRAPRKNTAIPEATPEEYEEAYKAGLTHLIGIEGKAEQPKQSNKKKSPLDYALQSDESDTGSAS